MEHMGTSGAMDRNSDYENRAYGERANEFYDGREGNEVLQAAWNLFGLTGSIEEYMLIKEIERRNEPGLK
ncbi:MAG: YqzL family protein [Lachnospiraceae bacterium]|nr:YqzL family protein [Lachnospiraceae bacterium]MDE6698915.1 YqzL family protein [Lachnospiraceae bacterium]